MPATVCLPLSRCDPRERPSASIVAEAILGLAVLAAAGCARTPPLGFSLNLEGRPPESVTAQQAAAIAGTLERLFGTPDEPRVPEAAGLTRERLAMAAGPIGGDAEGNQRGLFRRNCVTCHGVSGDGAGPTALSLDPYPRDFRSGVFKYTSTRGGTKPLARDLRRTLLRGIPGTAMPSFAQLRAEEIDTLVEYVKYLSIRGQTEQWLWATVVEGDAPLPLDDGEVIEDAVLPAGQAWRLPEDDPARWVVVPPSRPGTSAPGVGAASIAAGRAIYLGQQASCVKCHGPEGDGKGEQSELYDDWNKRKRGETPEETARLARLFKLPLLRLRPRDFRQGVFHGGSNPEDLYLRVSVGIKGTPMPPLGESPGVQAVLQPDEIWHVVSLVRALAAGAEAGAIQRKPLPAGAPGESALQR